MVCVPEPSENFLPNPKRKMRRLLCVMLGMFVLCSQLLAQNRTVTGKITNASGAPVANASVTVKGTNIGTTTTPEGTFSLSVPSTASILVVSSIGFQDQEVRIGSGNSVDVTLGIREQAMDEVVVTGYTATKRREATSSISKISGREVNSTPVVDANELLKGRVAGVVATSTSGQPGSVQQIRIRGINSLSAGNAPLYVIDGIIVARGQFNDDVQSQSSDILSNLNPNDIESINILKDASATSLYGARGANGVVVITTKKGKSGKAEINLKAQYGVTQPNFGKFELMNAEEWWNYERTALANAGYTPYLDQFHPQDELKVDHNWLNDAFIKGKSSKIDLSVSGGNENTRVYASGGYNAIDGIVLGSDLKRYSFLTNVSQKAGSRLTLNANLNLSYSDSRSADAGNRFSSPILGSFTHAPVQSPYKDDGSLYTGMEPGYWGFGADNFIYSSRLNSNRNNNLRLLGKVGADVQIANWLRFSQTAAVDWIDARQKTFQDARTADGISTNGYVYEAANQNKIYTTQSSLTGSYSMNGLHNFDYLALMEYSYTNSSSVSASTKSILANQKFRGLSAGATPSGAPSGSQGNLAFLSYVGQVGYNYNQRYFVTLNIRRDGTSQFTKNKSNTFYSAGGAWRIIREGFMANQNIFSELKLRGSYGTQGNISGLGNFEGFRLWAPVAYNDEPGITMAQLGNDELQWERTKSADLGVDMGFLKDRISATVDVYKKNTDRQLFAVPISSTSGFTTLTQNVGSVENKGLEVAVNSVNVKGRDFTWTTDANFSTNKNKVTELYNGQDIRSGQTLIRVGLPISSWYVREWAGVDPANGDPLWYDNNGNTTNVISQARRIVYGQPIPKHTFGLTNTFEYKGISLSVLLYGVTGVTILNQTRSFLESDGAYVYSGFNFTKNALNYWTKAGDVAENPKPIVGGNKSSYSLSTRYFEDGDYLRIKNVSLSYTLPAKISGKASLSRARIFAQAENLHTWTNYSGIDPEVGVDANEFFKYPVGKIYTVGIDVSFK
jgi:TonB-linked SusC/RagA family outer membrane protein